MDIVDRIIKLAVDHPGHRKEIVDLLIEHGVELPEIADKFETAMLKIADYRTLYRNWNGALYGKFVKKYKNNEEMADKIWYDPRAFAKKLKPEGRDIWNKWLKTIMGNRDTRKNDNIARAEKGLPPMPWGDSANPHPGRHNQGPDTEEKRIADRKSKKQNSKKGENTAKLPSTVSEPTTKLKEKKPAKKPPEKKPTPPADNATASTVSEELNKATGGNSDYTEEDAAYDAQYSVDKDHY